MMKYEMINLSKVTTYPLKKRNNLASRSCFAKPLGKNGTFADFYNSLPKIQSGQYFRKVVESVANAYHKKKQIVFLLGGHVIKCGLSPVLIDLMKEGFITALALNGAASIHDFEMALIGETSEDVAANLKTGQFGMVEETGYLMNSAINEGSKKNIGIGESLGEAVKKLKYRKDSLLFWGRELDIPITVHLAIGTDIIHQHPEADGNALGNSTFIDFRIFCNVVSGLEGGVVCNFGSAVLLPEIFLKAINIARNIGYNVRKFTAVNFDQIQHYRPNKNLVERPTAQGGEGYSFTGHHEFMLPLLAASVKEEADRRRK